jgi:glutamate dehydrogenase (NADP+)
VAQFTTEKIIELGGKVVTLSDSSGYVYDEAGIDAEKLEYVKTLKNIKRGRIKEYVDKYSKAVYTPVDPAADSNPLWDHPADCAFPCATQNEINEIDAQHLIKNNARLVCEGANMPTTPEGIALFLDSHILYAPGKASNAGGVAVSGLEMSQNSMRLNWPRQEVDHRLQIIMKSIHQTCLDAAEAYGTPGNYLNGANIAGFVKVVGAMLDQGLV